MNWYTIVSVAVIPAVVWLLRKVKLPSKFCPIAAFVVAGILVGVGKLFGVELNANDIGQAILTALATAGVSVLGYDAVKKIVSK